MAAFLASQTAGTRPVTGLTGPRVQIKSVRPRTLLRVVAEDNGVATEAKPVAEEKKERKPSPLERGGTLSGEAAAGKDASAKAVEKFVAGEKAGSRQVLQIVDGYFRDYRWKDGRWVLDMFKKDDGEVDWDAVIDAEMARRKLLEDTPIPSTNEEPVFFDTAEIPWWAWVRRFHLPEAEKLNGRAAMVGYAAAWGVDRLSGAGLVDQQSSFIGLLLLHITVFGVLLFRNQDSFKNFRNLIDEATFYDKQWNATWEGQTRPSETEK